MVVKVSLGYVAQYEHPVRSRSRPVGEHGESNSKTEPPITFSVSGSTKGQKIALTEALPNHPLYLSFFTRPVPVEVRLYGASVLSKEVHLGHRAAVPIEIR